MNAEGSILRALTSAIAPNTSTLLRFTGCVSGSSARFFAWAKVGRARDFGPKTPPPIAPENFVETARQS